MTFKLDTKSTLKYYKTILDNEIYEKLEENQTICIESISNRRS